LAAETRAVQLRLWIAADDRQAVAAWAGAWAHAAVAPAGFRHAQDQITLARAWLALGRAQEALVLLNRLSASIPVDELPRCHAELLLLSAVAQHMLGEQAKACAALLKSLALATPMSCLRLYLDEGTTGVALVAALGRPHDMPPAVQGFTQQILAAAPASAAVVKPLSPTAMRAVTVPKVGQLVEPLTARELEVLALLAAGCSNQEIAARLVVTLHAVKKHTGSIYGKLGVGSRTQAMVRARELGLVT
jgi:LuxR family maltose regulon positive regulatory protein